MKRVMLPALIFSALLFSCGDNTGKKVNDTVTEKAAEAGLTVNDEEDKTGKFSFDGKEVSGKIQTQYFGDKEKGNFSVLCEHNESNDPANANFERLQVIFLTEKDATTNLNLKIYDGGSSLPMTEPEPGIVAVSLEGVGNGLDQKLFTGTGKSTGSIKVNNHTVEIKDLVLFTRDGEKRTVNATLEF
ncbi:hypothetical protein [Niabella aquatica]